MSLDAFRQPGRFFRGNLHTHSNLSDGEQTPEAVCAHYREAGYDFLALTDHFTEPLRLSDLRHAALPHQPFHHDPRRRAARAGQLAERALAHPRRRPARGFCPERRGRDRCRAGGEGGRGGCFRGDRASAMVEPDDRGRAGARLAHAVEIYNHSCALECERGDGAVLLDTLLNEGRQLTAVATDDAHFRVDDACGGWVMVKAEENEPAALLAALKAGHFYASQGPLIHDAEVQAARSSSARPRSTSRRRARVARRQHPQPPADARGAAARPLPRRLVPLRRHRRGRSLGLDQPGLAGTQRGVRGAAREGGASRPSIHARPIVPAASRPEVCQRARSVPSCVGGSRAREDRLAILVMWRSSRAPRGDYGTRLVHSSSLRGSSKAGPKGMQPTTSGRRLVMASGWTLPGAAGPGFSGNPVAAPPALPETRRSRSGPSVKSGSAEHRGGLRCGD